MAASDLALKILISARDTASSVVRGTVRILGDLRTQVTLLVSTLGLWQAAEAGVGAAARYEDMQQQFEGLLGSAEAARAKLKELDDAFGLRQVGQAQDLFAQLTAFGLQPTVAQLRALIDFNARTGKGAENLSAIVAQLGQAWGKEKLQYEDIIILLERGIPIWELLGKATGHTTAELSKMASEGALGRDMITTLIAEMGKVADGASIARLKTWTGLWEATLALWERVQREIMAGGAFDWLKGKLAEVADVLEYSIQSGAARRWGEQFGAAVTDAGAWVEKMTGYARQLVGTLQVVLGGFSAFANSAVAAVARAAAALVPQLNEQAARIFPGLNDALTGLRASFMDTFNRAKESAGEAMGSIVAGWDEINRKVGDSAPEESWQGLVEKARAYNAEVAKTRQDAAAASAAVKDMGAGTAAATAQAEALRRAYEAAGLSAEQAARRVEELQRRAAAPDAAAAGGASAGAGSGAGTPAPVAKPDAAAATRTGAGASSGAASSAAGAGDAARRAVEDAFKAPIVIRIDATAAAAAVVRQVQEALAAASLTVAVTAVVTQVQGGGGGVAGDDLSKTAAKTGGMQG